MNSITRLALVASVLTAGCAAVPRTSATPDVAMAGRTTQEACIVGGRLTPEACIRPVTMHGSLLALTASSPGGQTARSRDRRVAILARR
jgi:hypothetical protein